MKRVFVDIACVILDLALWGCLLGLLIGPICGIIHHADLAHKVPSAQRVSTPAVTRMVDRLSHGREHVVKVFNGPDGLLGAVVANAADQRQIAWLSPHAKVLMTGTLLSATGTDLTQQAKIQQGLVLSPTAALVQATLPARHSILVGTGGPLITAFIDPNCIYCHHLYEALAPLIAAGRVRVRYVVVGTLKASSVPRAASILGASDPARALARNEAAYDAESEEGGYPIAPTIDPSLVSAVTGNNRLFASAGMTGTPEILYCPRASRDVALEPGLPVDLGTFLSGAGICP